MSTKSIAIILALSTMFAASCSSDKEEQKKSDKPAVSAAPTPPPVFTLEKGVLHTELRVPSELSAYKQVDLYAKVNSYVKSLSVDVGSEVKQGQLLATLEAPELVSQLAAAQSKYKAQEAIYEASNATYERILDASKTPGTISKNDVDVALAKRNSDRSQMEAAQADYRANSTITQYLTIRAPFDGVISVRNVNLGAYIGPSGKGSELPIFTLQEQKHLRLVIEVPEANKGMIKLNDIVKFTVKAFPDKMFSGKITRRAGVMDKTLRSEHIELDVANDDLALSPGMVAEAIIGLDGSANTFLVPKSAVVNATDGVYMILDSISYAKRIPVRTGRLTDSLVEVFGEQLLQGQNFVTRANEEIHNGDPIKK